VPGAASVTLEGDRRAAERALSNLLDNAIKFSPGGGEVRVVAQADEAGIRIAVEDGGPGIPREDQERIFAPFVRLDRELPGSGLGLSIARALAEAQGGTLTVESEPGRGSRFLLTLRTP
jgi:signal transduction histidine kinase